ncbi:MAG: glutamine synthetase type III, partial [Raoultibacter sp.]
YIKKSLTKHQRIIFNGNGYADEWPIEAEKRGLANHPTTADALPCYIDQKSIDLFESFDVLSETEVYSRYEVKLEKYNKLMNIEIRVMKRMARRTFLPAVNEYIGELAATVANVKAAVPGANTEQQEETLLRLLNGVAKANEAYKVLDELHHEIQELEDQQEKANRYAHEAVPAMEALRSAVDLLEKYTDRDHWPVPTYNDMLFYV